MDLGDWELRSVGVGGLGSGSLGGPGGLGSRSVGEPGDWRLRSLGVGRLVSEARARGGHVGDGVRDWHQRGDLGD